MTAAHCAIDDPPIHTAIVPYAGLLGHGMSSLNTPFLAFRDVFVLSLCRKSGSLWNSNDAPFFGRWVWLLELPLFEAVSRDVLFVFPRFPNERLKYEPTLKNSFSGIKNMKTGLLAIRQAHKTVTCASITFQLARLTLSPILRECYVGQSLRRTYKSDPSMRRMRNGSECSLQCMF